MVFLLPYICFGQYEPIRAVHRHLGVERIAQTHLGDGVLQIHLDASAAAHVRLELPCQIPDEVQIVVAVDAVVLVERQLVNGLVGDVGEFRDELGEGAAYRCVGKSFGVGAVQ